jgi:hypothetical protein
MFSVTNPNIKDVGANGKGEIKYHIKGLERWGNLAEFEISISRSHTYRHDGPDEYEWSYKVGNLGYSITQKDPNGYLNYAAALKAAATRIEELVAMEDQLEAMWQEAEAQRKAEHEAEQERIRIQREADKPVGEKLAKKIIETMKREVKKLGRYDTQTILAFKRGTREEMAIKVEFSRSGMGLFSLGWGRISKKDAIAMLADSHLGSLDVSGCPSLPDPNVAAFMMSKK